MADPCQCGSAPKPAFVNSLVRVRFTDFSDRIADAIQLGYRASQDPRTSGQFDITEAGDFNYPTFGNVFLSGIDEFCRNYPPLVPPGVPFFVSPWLQPELARIWQERCQCNYCPRPANELPIDGGLCTGVFYRIRFDIVEQIQGGGTRFITQFSQCPNEARRGDTPYGFAQGRIRFERDPEGRPAYAVMVTRIGLPGNIIRTGVGSSTPVEGSSLLIRNLGRCDGLPDECDRPVPDLPLLALPPFEPLRPEGNPPEDSDVTIVIIPAQPCSCPDPIPGERGEKGDKGDPGEKGLDGLRGLDGERGAVGAQGVPGERGAPGIQGARGADGAPSSIQLRNVSLGAFGSPGSAIEVVGGQNKVYDIEVPEMAEFRPETLKQTLCEEGIEVVSDVVIPLLATATGSFKPFAQLILDLAAERAKELCKPNELDFEGEVLLFESVCTEDDPVKFSPTIPGKFAYWAVYVTFVPDDAVRVYRLAGRDSEYGLGNANLVRVDNQGDYTVIGNRNDLYTRYTIIPNNEEYTGVRVRVSLKFGCSFLVYYRPIEE